MAYKNKTYVAFDADNDITYYRLMQGWKANNNINFNFHNAHELNNISADSSEETIKRRLSERLNDTKLMILLVGTQTKYHNKFVRWEVESALNLETPIVVVNLNKSKEVDNELCPAIIRDKLALHIPFKQKPITWAIDNWIDEHNRYKKNNDSAPKIILASLYTQWSI
jgi:hypothetical protein